MATTLLQTSTFLKTDKAQFQSKRSSATARAGPSAARVAGGIVRCQASNEQASTPSAVSRRGLLSAATFATPILYAAQALALIDYDEDDELLAKIRADRKSKLQSELIAERQGTRSQGFKSAQYDKEVSQVQAAVNQLSKSGAFLESGDMSSYKAAVTEADWVEGLKTASKEISFGADARSASETMFKAIGDLQKNAGNSKAATKSYLSTLEAFEAWCAASGVAESVEGL